VLKWKLDLHVFVGRLLISTKPTNARSTLSLERQVNKLSNTFEKYKELSDQQHQHTNEKLTKLLEVVSRLTPDDVAFSGHAASHAASMTPVASDPKPYLSNPELIAIISKVASETRNRVGKKKGGTDDNSLKVKS
jgi:hypothetical protein